MNTYYLYWSDIGTIVPMKFYKISNKVQSIMIEVNRRLYLEEPTNQKSQNYGKTKQVVLGFLDTIKSKINAQETQ